MIPINTDNLNKEKKRDKHFNCSYRKKFKQKKKKLVFLFWVSHIRALGNHRIGEILIGRRRWTMPTAHSKTTRLRIRLSSSTWRSCTNVWIVKRRYRGYDAILRHVCRVNRSVVDWRVRVVDCVRSVGIQRWIYGRLIVAWWQIHTVLRFERYLMNTKLSFLFI